MGYKKYEKRLDYSYSFGVYPTLELFKYKREKIEVVFLHTAGEKNSGVQEIKKLCDRYKIRYEYSDGLFSRITDKENTYAIGVFKKYQSKLTHINNHVVLVNPSNAGNLGTIIRTMIGFGISDLGLIRPASDVFDPKVIRASMGEIFQINFEYFDNFDQYKKSYQNKIYSFMLNGDKEVSDTDFEQPYSLVFGNESSGLDKKFKGYGKNIYIAHKNNIDSLNVSVAVGIGLYFSNDSK